MYFACVGYYNVVCLQRSSMEEWIEVMNEEWMTNSNLEDWRLEMTMDP